MNRATWTLGGGRIKLGWKSALCLMGVRKGLKVLRGCLIIWGTDCPNCDHGIERHRGGATSIVSLLGRQLKVNEKERWSDKFDFDPNLRVFVARMVLLSIGNSYIWLAIMTLACLLPLSSPAQAIRHESPVAVDHWRWATSDQAVLRVMALDTKLQQVVVKVDDGGLTILKRGGAIPQLAVSLAAVSGSAAVFYPLKVPGQQAVERINIVLVGGKQVTSVSRLVPPARTTASGWAVVPR